MIAVLSLNLALIDLTSHSYIEQWHRSVNYGMVDYYLNGKGRQDRWLEALKRYGVVSII